METTKKPIRVKKTIEFQKPLGRHRSMNEASAANMESAKEFIANVDVTLFKQNGHVE